MVHHICAIVDLGWMSCQGGKTGYYIAQGGRVAVSGVSADSLQSTHHCVHIELSSVVALAGTPGR